MIPWIDVALSLSKISATDDLGHCSAHVVAADGIGDVTNDGKDLLQSKSQTFKVLCRQDLR